MTKFAMAQNQQILDETVFNPLVMTAEGMLQPSCFNNSGKIWSQHYQRITVAY
jgi:hypothetical protein